jgi:hypothetical protein
LTSSPAMHLHPIPLVGQSYPGKIVVRFPDSVISQNSPQRKKEKVP